MSTTKPQVTRRITIKTTHGVYRGRSVDSIIRRVYGKRAYLYRDLIVADVHRACHGVSWEANVLGRLVWADGNEKTPGP